MADHESSKLNVEGQLVLDRPLLRMPYNLSRQTFKNAHRLVDHEEKTLKKDLTSAIKYTQSSSPNQETTLSHIDAMLTRMTTLKRKLEKLSDEECSAVRASKARLQHLADLHKFPSVVDTHFEDWARKRLTRLVVDYLLRRGYVESAKDLAREEKVEELVDIEAFVSALRIERSLREKRDVKLALQWCKENGQALKKVEGFAGPRGLENELRLQQVVEMAREAWGVGKGEEGEAEGERMEVDDGDGRLGSEIGGSAAQVDHEKQAKQLQLAHAHAKKYLSTTPELAGPAAVLLTIGPASEQSKKLFSPSRWTHLASLFVSTHHTLFALPSHPLLATALAAGISALKTPACHSKLASSSANALSSSSSICPICSTELNELAKDIPYVQQRKSIVEEDPVVLPNGRVYGKKRLYEFQRKVGTEKGWVRDPMGGLGMGGPSALVVGGGAGQDSVGGAMEMGGEFAAVGQGVREIKDLLAGDISSAREGVTAGEGSSRDARGGREDKGVVGVDLWPESEVKRIFIL